MNDNEIKHLEFIQSNIARMGQNSFQMKGWALAVITALITLYAVSVESGCSGNEYILFIGIPPTAIFWFLDAYYLQQERKFRGVYNDVARLTNDTQRINVRAFEMPLTKYRGGKYCLIRVIFSLTEWPLYLVIIAGLFIGGVLLS